jgi:hypothetical protein
MKTGLTALALAVLLAVLPQAFAGGYGIASEWNNILDFMVQDACVDGNDKPLVGLSPAAAECKRHRDLKSGELLPYHKADWPGDSDRNGQALGYERNDSFPFDTSPLGTVVIQTFDFGSGAGRKFGQFDHGDGGQVVGFSHDTAAVILTEDGGRGLQLMAGPRCAPKEEIRPGRTLDSWLIASKSAESGQPGQSLARLRIVTDSACPPAFDNAYTEWHFAEFRYRATLAGDLTPPLKTLVSSHFGGKDVATADHLERFYFTREFGWTRWERWQNMTYSKDPSRQTERGSSFAKTGRCQPRAPAPGDSWLLLDCREWTNIVKPDSPEGDQPAFWLERLKDYPLTRDFFIGR